MHLQHDDSETILVNNLNFHVLFGNVYDDDDDDGCLDEQPGGATTNGALAFLAVAGLA